MRCFVLGRSPEKALCVGREPAMLRRFDLATMKSYPNLIDRFPYLAYQATQGEPVGPKRNTHS